MQKWTNFITTDREVASENILKVIRCNCKETAKQCGTNRCCCRKNGLDCATTCHAEDYENRMVGKYFLKSCHKGLG